VLYRVGRKNPGASSGKRKIRANLRDDCRDVPTYLRKHGEKGAVSFKRASKRGAGGSRKNPNLSGRISYLGQGWKKNLPKGRDQNRGRTHDYYRKAPREEGAKEAGQSKVFKKPGKGWCNAYQFWIEKKRFLHTKPLGGRISQFLVRESRVHQGSFYFKKKVLLIPPKSKNELRHIIKMGVFLSVCGSEPTNWASRSSSTPVLLQLGFQL